MMTTQERTDRRRQIMAAAVTAIVTIAAVVVLLLVGLRYSAPDDNTWPPPDTSELLLEGEYVKIGDIPQPVQDQTPAPSASDVASSEAQDMTDSGDPAPDPAPLLTSQVESPAKVARKPEPVKTGPTEAELREREKAKREREAAEKIRNRVAFGGTSSGGTATGVAGSPQGNASSGSLSGAPGTSLAGRTLQHWAKPEGTATGEIVIRVRVDRQGRVESAEYYRGSGPVASMQAARNSCVEAARRSRFSVAPENSPETQSGTITYRFK